MLFQPRVKIDKALYDKLEEASQAGGYASVDEFVLHILEKAVEDIGEADSEEEIRKRLQGLGYLD